VEPPLEVEWGDLPEAALVDHVFLAVSEVSDRDERTLLVVVLGNI
jgi:hypothetical protein